MKIFYFANLRLPTEKAHGVQIMQMCAAFATANPEELRHGASHQLPTVNNTVTLVFPFRWRTRNLRGVKDVFAYYGVEKNFRIVRLPSLDLFPVTRTFPFLDRLAFAIQYGSFLFSVPLFLILKSWLSLVSFPPLGNTRDKLRRESSGDPGSRMIHVLNDNGISGMTCKKPEDDEMGAVIYTRDSRIARTATRFTKNVFLELHTIPKRDDVETVQRVSGVIVVTQKLKEMLKQNGIAEERIIVAPDAVNISAFEQVTESAKDLRKKLHLPLDATLIGYIGRLKTFGREKGIPELIEAFAKLYAVHKDVRLVIVGGDSADAYAYHRQLRDLGIASRIHFISHVAPTDVPKYLKAFDILVAPFPKTDHYAYAMSPLKIFEYMASEKPMVVSDLPSIREVLSEEEAFFVEPGSAEDLAITIGNVLDNPDEARRRAERAKEIVQTHTWEERAGEVLGFIGRSVVG